MQLLRSAASPAGCSHRGASKPRAGHISKSLISQTNAWLSSPGPCLPLRCRTRLWRSHPGCSHHHANVDWCWAVPGAGGISLPSQAAAARPGTTGVLTAPFEQNRATARGANKIPAALAARLPGESSKTHVRSGTCKLSAVPFLTQTLDAGEVAPASQSGSRRAEPRPFPSQQGQACSQLAGSPDALGEAMGNSSPESRWANPGDGQLQSRRIAPPLETSPKSTRTLQRPEQPALVLFLYSSFEMEPKAEPSTDQMESVTERT